MKKNKISFNESDFLTENEKEHVKLVNKSAPSITLFSSLSSSSKKRKRKNQLIY